MNWTMIKQSAWGAVGGAIVLAFVGFTWGGWTTGGAAAQMASNAASDAVTARLAEICVAQYEHDGERAEKLAELMKLDTWKRSDQVEKLGWSTMPGETKANSQVARKCADELSKLSS